MDDFGADLKQAGGHFARLWYIYKDEGHGRKRQLGTIEAFLIELGEPETWLESDVAGVEASALHAEGIGDVGLSRRWQTLPEGPSVLLIAATVHDPLTETNQSGAQCSVYQGERQEPTQAILSAALQSCTRQTHTAPSPNLTQVP